MGKKVKTEITGEAVCNECQKSRKRLARFIVVKRDPSDKEYISKDFALCRACTKDMLRYHVGALKAAMSEALEFMANNPI